MYNSRVKEHPEEHSRSMLQCIIIMLIYSAGIRVGEMLTFLSFFLLLAALQSPIVWNKNEGESGCPIFCSTGGFFGDDGSWKNKWCVMNGFQS